MSLDYTRPRLRLCCLVTFHHLLLLEFHSTPNNIFFTNPFHHKLLVPFRQSTYSGKIIRPSNIQIQRVIYTREFAWQKQVLVQVEHRSFHVFLLGEPSESHLTLLRCIHVHTSPLSWISQLSSHVVSTNSNKSLKSPKQVSNIKTWVDKNLQELLYLASNVTHPVHWVNIKYPHNHLEITLENMYPCNAMLARSLRRW